MFLDNSMWPHHMVIYINVLETNGHTLLQDLCLFYGTRQHCPNNFSHKLSHVIMTNIHVSVKPNKTLCHVSFTLKHHS